MEFKFSPLIVKKEELVKKDSISTTRPSMPIPSMSMTVQLPNCSSARQYEDNGHSSEDTTVALQQRPLTVGQIGRRRRRLRYKKRLQQRKAVQKRGKELLNEWMAGFLEGVRIGYARHESALSSQNF